MSDKANSDTNDTNDTSRLISFSQMLREAGLPWSQRTLELLLFLGIEAKAYFGTTKLYSPADAARLKRYAADKRTLEVIGLTN